MNDKVAKNLNQYYNILSYFPSYETVPPQVKLFQVSSLGLAPVIDNTNTSLTPADDETIQVHSAGKVETMRYEGMRTDVEAAK